MGERLSPQYRGLPPLWRLSRASLGLPMPYKVLKTSLSVSWRNCKSWFFSLRAQSELSRGRGRTTLASAKLRGPSRGKGSRAPLVSRGSACGGDLDLIRRYGIHRYGGPPCTSVSPFIPVRLEPQSWQLFEC